jgi:transposase
MDIRELILQMRRYSSDRAVARVSGMHRRTVKRYRQWAREQGLLAGALPVPEALARLVQETLPEKPPPQNVSSLEAYRAVISQWHKERVEMTAMLQRLRERGYTGSYSAVRRFVKGLSTAQREVFVRVECKPGEEGQADFGYAGWLLDPASGQLRRAWAFVMTLSWSRHQYVEFVFDQKLSTWVLLHRHAFEFFGGVPERIVVDNLKAAIVQACFDDPLVQQTYRECAEHYGFLIAPCRPATPQHKGKVEQGGVHYVKRNFLAGREATLLTQANQDVRLWCNTTAGLRIHGTTREQPWLRFTQTEQAHLQPLPTTAYDLAVWKEATVGSDGYITFDNAYYSVPCRVPRGAKLRIRGGAQWVTIYTQQHELVATHDRAQQAGQRITQLTHLPADKVPGLLVNREGCRVTAASIGPATSQVVNLWLDDPAVDRLRTAGRLLRLGEQYGHDQLEAACTRALQFGEPAYATVKRILVTGLAETTSGVMAPDQPPGGAPPAPPVYTFARSAAELLGHLFGGVPWN